MSAPTGLKIDPQMVDVRTPTHERNGPRLLEALERRTLLSAIPNLIDINLGTADGVGNDFTRLGDSIYFTAILHEGNGGANGGLFKTDGTDAGTTLLRQLSIWNIVQAGGKLFIIANA